MKSTLLILFLFANPLFAQQQNYNVIKVNGGLYNVTQKEQMISGKKVLSDDEVQFSTLENNAFVISPDNGRFMMVPEKQLTAKTRTVLRPLSRRTALTTRGVSPALPEKDLYRFFGKKNFLFLDTVTRVWIDTTAIKVSGNHTIIARVTGKEGKEVTKKIKVEQGSLLIRIDELFPEKNAEGALLPGPVKIYQFNQMSRELIQCADFTPQLVNRSVLIHEINLITKAMGPQTPKEILYEEIETFVFASYGPTNPNDLKKFLRDNLSMEF